MAFVVFAGQSNTGGAYMDASTLPRTWRPDPLTLIWNDDAGAWEEMRPGENTGFGQMPQAWGPEVQFAMDFRAAHPDEVLRIVKSAWGGARLEPDTGEWAFDWSDRSDDEIFDITRAMIDRAAQALGGTRPEAVFWGQGEEDANHPAAAEAYDENLPALFQAIRTEWLQDPDGKIGFFRITGSAPYTAEVRHAQAATDQADPNADSFDARDYPLLGDGLHFAPAGHQMSGADFFALFQGWRAGAPDDGGEAGQVLTSNGPGDALVGGAGPDTLNASAGPDLLTGGAGADRFAWAAAPWSPARVTDFTPGEDGLDLGALLGGYSGADPIADGYVYLFDDGEGGTKVLVDADGPGGEWPGYVVRLEGVATEGLTWSALYGGGAAPPPPDEEPEDPPPEAEPGVRLESSGPGDTLQGGAGADTLVASRGSDVLVGGAGADRFEWPQEPWSPAQVRDFTPGEDQLDISAWLRAAGVSGDPFASGHLRLIEDGAGGSKVLFDRDGPGPDPQWANYVIHLEGVAPNAVRASDWVFN